jgi:hypothetical protein
LALRRFNIYIHDYCHKRGFHKTARELMTEADIPPESSPPINARQGLLFEYVYAHLSISRFSHLIFPGGGVFFGCCSQQKPTVTAPTKQCCTRRYEDLRYHFSDISPDKYPLFLAPSTAAAASSSTENTRATYTTASCRSAAATLDATPTYKPTPKCHTIQTRTSIPPIHVQRHFWTYAARRPYFLPYAQRTTWPTST